MNELDSMFSSNQKLDITCDFKALPHVIDFAFSLAGCKSAMTRSKDRVELAQQITNTGLYCLGTGSMKTKNIPAGNGWTDLPFTYDPEIIASIVTGWVKKQTPKNETGTDGTEELGCRIRGLMSLPYDTGHSIKNPLECIIAIEPYFLGYDK